MTHRVQSDMHCVTRYYNGTFLLPARSTGNHQPSEWGKKMGVRQKVLGRFGIIWTLQWKKRSRGHRVICLSKVQVKIRMGDKEIAGMKGDVRSFKSLLFQKRSNYQEIWVAFSGSQHSSLRRSQILSSNQTSVFFSGSNFLTGRRGTVQFRSEAKIGRSVYPRPSTFTPCWVRSGTHDNERTQCTKKATSKPKSSTCPEYTFLPVMMNFQHIFWFKSSIVCFFLFFSQLWMFRKIDTRFVTLLYS